MNDHIVSRLSLWVLAGALTAGTCLAGCKDNTSIRWDWWNKPKAETPPPAAAIQPETSPVSEQPASPPREMVNENCYIYAFKTYGKAMNAGEKKQLMEMFDAVRDSFGLVLAEQKESLKLPTTPPDMGANVWVQPAGQPAPAKTADPDAQILVFKATDVCPLTITVSFYTGKYAGLYYVLQGTKAVSLAEWLDLQTK